MFQITSGGIYTKHDKSFYMNRPQGFDRYVLLITHTEVLFSFPDAEYHAAPHHAVYIAPHVPYSYHNPGHSYSDDWLHFTCNSDDRNLIPDALFHHPFPVNNHALSTSYIHQLLYENNYAPTELKYSHIDALFHMLNDHLIYEFNTPASTPYSPYLYPMQQLRMDMQAAPHNAKTANEAAASIGISLSYFQHLYSKFFHISYQKDLISMKLSYAKELLRTTNMTVEEIAYNCGYSGTVHFYRQFLSSTGMTPTTYKQNFIIKL